MSDALSTHSELSPWLESLFDSWKLQRQALEEKWNRNWAAYKRNAKLDPKGVWKRSDKAEDWQSDTVFPVTKQKAVAAYSIITDMMFQGGRVAFMLVPEGVGSDEPPPEPAAVEERDKFIQKLEDAIHRQLKDSNAIDVLSDSVLSGAVMGEAYLKRVVKPSKRVYYEQTGPNLWDAVRWSRPQPAVEYRTPWAIVRDLESDDIREGDGYFESAPASRHQIEQLVGQPHFLPRSVIRAALDRSGGSASGTSGSPSATDQTLMAPELRDVTGRLRDRRLREFWGLAPRNLVERFERYVARVQADPAAAVQFSPGDTFGGDPEDKDAQYEMVEIHAIQMDSVIIRFARTERQDRPIYRVVFERELDSLGGVSVADNVEDEQHVITGLTRSIEDNSKLAGNVLLALKRAYLDSDFDRIRPGMTIDISDSCPDARMAVAPIEIPDVTGPQMKLLELFMAFADLSAQLPRAQQGVQEENPQTAFELKERLERAGKYLGGVIRQYDRLVEEAITDMYDYNMRDETFFQPKGRYRVVALGFSSFENRVVRMNRLILLLRMALEFEDLRAISKIRYIWAEITKGNDVEPAQFVKTVEEIEADLETARQRLTEEQAAAASGQAGGNDPLAREKLIREIGRLEAETADKAASAGLKAAQAKKTETDTLLQRAGAVMTAAVPGAAAPEPGPAPAPAEPTGLRPPPDLSAPLPAPVG